MKYFDSIEMHFNGNRFYYLNKKVYWKRLYIKTSTQTVVEKEKNLKIKIKKSTCLKTI